MKLRCILSRSTWLEAGQEYLVSPIEGDDEHWNVRYAGSYAKVSKKCFAEIVSNEQLFAFGWSNIASLMLELSIAFNNLLPLRLRHAEIKADDNGPYILLTEGNFTIHPSLIVYKSSDDRAIQTFGWSLVVSYEPPESLDEVLYQVPQDKLIGNIKIVLRSVEAIQQAEREYHLINRVDALIANE